METLHQVGDVTVPRPQRRLSKGQIAATVVGAVVVGIVAGWISYLVLSPSEASGALRAAEIASIRSAELPALHEAQWLSDPANVASLRGAELPGLFAAQFASTPEGIALLRGAELPGLFAAQFASTPEGIALAQSPVR
ncbi:MAG: hypothetical protein MUQ27_03265 [Acidimicrobiia bacterium]|nr:hypothetical protein [Acidimicrobiia bacterium]